MSYFRNAENFCETLFNSRIPYWHLYTSGKNTPTLFATKESMAFVMNVMCQAAFKSDRIRIVAFTIMNNHVHLLICGQEADVAGFFDFLKKRVFRGLDIWGIVPSSFSPQMKPVTELSTLRNTIAYIHRNGYVANPNYTPFSYPWGTGKYYFNDIPTVRTYGDLTFKEKRTLFKGRVPDIPDSSPIIDGHVSPAAYCGVQFGMQLFRDAHHYLSTVTKNVEAYTAMALEFEDSEFLSDAEVFTQVVKMAKSDNVSIRTMTKAQKLEYARKLHYDCHCSNGQICRTLNLSRYDVDSIFPLKAGA